MPAHPSPAGEPRLRWRWGRLAVVAGVLAAMLVALGAVLTSMTGSDATPAASTSTPVASPATTSPAAPATGTSGSATSSSALSGTAPAGTDGTDGDLEVGPIPRTVPRAGSGSTTVLPVPGTDSDREGRRVRYTVEIEGGLGVSPTYFAAKVREVLTDERGWEPRDGIHFVNVSPQQRAAGAATDIRIILGSPDLVDEYCAPLRTGGRLSCHARGKVMLNVDRWAHGADTYGEDVKNYRIYQISHEVGHAVGHGHQGCPAPDAPAPVMVQQTKDLFGCRPWPWPTRPTG